jgi:hypothetical protein
MEGIALSSIILCDSVAWFLHPQQHAVIRSFSASGVTGIVFEDKSIKIS